MERQTERTPDFRESRDIPGRSSRGRALLWMSVAVGAGLLAGLAQLSGTSGAGAQEISIDGSTVGNSATSLGTRDGCVHGVAGSTVTVDVTAAGIPLYNDFGTPGSGADDTGGIIGFSYRLDYDAAKLSIEAQNPNLLVAANTASSLFNGGDPVEYGWLV